MKQVVLSIVAGLLLIAAVLLSVLWVKSYRGVDSFGVYMLDAKSIQSDIQIGIGSEWGRFKGGINRLDYPGIERIWKFTSVKHHMPIRPDLRVGYFGCGDFYLETKLHHQDQISIHAFVFRVPHWVLVLMFALWPAVRFTRMYRRHRKRQKAITDGHCLNCGYDMRATPDRCPECGHLAGATVPKKKRLSPSQKVIMLGIGIISVTWLVVLMSV